MDEPHCLPWPVDLTGPKAASSDSPRVYDLLTTECDLSLHHLSLYLGPPGWKLWKWLQLALHNAFRKGILLLTDIVI
jgi:hypothetical protein